MINFLRLVRHLLNGSGCPCEVDEVAGDLVVLGKYRFHAVHVRGCRVRMLGRTWHEARPNEFVSVILPIIARRLAADQEDVARAVRRAEREEAERLAREQYEREHAAREAERSAYVDRRKQAKSLAGVTATSDGFMFKVEDADFGIIKAIAEFAAAKVAERDSGWWESMVAQSDGSSIAFSREGGFSDGQ